MNDYKHLEREYDPNTGDFGNQGWTDLSNKDFEEMEVPGFTPFIPAGGDSPFLPVYNSDRTLSGQMWRGFIREDNGKHYCISFTTTKVN